MADAGYAAFSVGGGEDSRDCGSSGVEGSGASSCFANTGGGESDEAWGLCGGIGERAMPCRDDLGVVSEVCIGEEGGGTGEDPAVMANVALRAPINL